MAEKNEAIAPKPAATPTPTAKAADSEKKTLTLSFEGKDLDLHKKITDDAENDERTPSVNVLRFLRQHYSKTPA